VIGERIRRRRRELGLTLRELADRTGVSVSFLSQVENNRCNPSLDSIHRIATALGVQLLYFRTDDNINSPITRAHERPKLHFRNPNVGYELLTRYLGGATMAMVLRFQPGERRSAEALAQQTEQWMYVLQGTMEITVKGEQYILWPGDFIVYAGNDLEETACIGENELEVLCCFAPPIL